MVTSQVVSFHTPAAAATARARALLQQRPAERARDVAARQPAGERRERVVERARSWAALLLPAFQAVVAEGRRAW